MDAIQSLNPANSFAQAANGAAAQSAVSSDFETFLKMLAVQLQNQDPLNPVDSADYAVQLATFSSVEQQVLTNQLLEGLMAQQGVAGMTGFASWIGLEARSLSPAFFDGSAPVELAPNPLTSADETKLVVFDANGDEMARIDIPVSADPYFWDGTDQNGDTLPAGLYSFGLENFTNGELMVTDALETYARVVEARNENGQVILVLAGDVLVPSAAVSGLREPSD